MRAYEADVNGSQTVVNEKTGLEQFFCAKENFFTGIFFIFYFERYARRAKELGKSIKFLVFKNILYSFLLQKSLKVITVRLYGIILY